MVRLTRVLIHLSGPVRILRCQITKVSTLFLATDAFIRKWAAQKVEREAGNSCDKGPQAGFVPCLGLTPP